MTELLEQSDLGGDDLKIWRLRPPMRLGEGARFLDFFLSTTRSYYSRRTQSYWRLYNLYAFDGKNAPEIEDVFYFAEVNGEVAARLWFGFAPGNGFGNFGNVFTAEKFRRRGILRRLMAHFAKDFQASSAMCLSCDVGSEYVARTYGDYGFRLLFGGKVGPMAIVKPECGDFPALEGRFLGDAVPVRFRPGTVGDQFMVDKFLHYCAKVYRRSPTADLDYRCCMLECRHGNGVVAVAENAAGAPVGFAWAGALDGMNRLVMALHPDAAPHCGDMLRRLRADQNGGPLCHIQLPGGEAHTPALEAAGARCLCTLGGGSVIWEL